ncbi:MAG: O-antigen ligase family protein [Candidatus Firestonebacteria bacterium]|nr:O-antigen ligase family protein [Candidatus Firestonebacteria bacterium]
MKNIEVFEKIIKYLFIIFVISLPFSISINQITIVLIFFVWIGKMIYTKKIDFIPTSVFIPAIIYILINILGVIFGINLQRGLHELAGLLLIIVFFITVNLVKKEDLKLLVNLLILASTIFALIGIYQYIEINKGFINIHSIRIQGLLGSIFDFAWFLVYVILLSISVLWQMEQNIYENLFLLFAILIMSIALVFTYTRGAWLGLISGILLISFIKDKRIILPVIFLIVLIAYINPSFIERVKTIPDLKMSSNNIRLEIWDKGIKIIKDNPILGVGMGNYSLAADKNGKYPVHDHSHNNYIQQGVNAGIPGLAAFFWMIWCLLNEGYKYIKENINNNISIGCFAGLVSFLVSGFVDYSLKNDISITLFWFLMGLMVLSREKDRNITNNK